MPAPFWLKRALDTLSHPYTTSSRAPDMSDGAVTTPFPSRPRLHSASPTRSTPDEQTPRELRTLEAAWRSLRPRSSPLLTADLAQALGTEELSTKAAGWLDASRSAAPSTRPTATTRLASSSGKENESAQPTSHLAKVVDGRSKSRRQLPDPSPRPLASGGSRSSWSTDIPLAQQQQQMRLYPSTRLPSASRDGLSSNGQGPSAELAGRSASHASSAGTHKAVGSPPEPTATRHQHNSRRAVGHIAQATDNPDVRKSRTASYDRYSWEAGASAGSLVAQPTPRKQPRDSIALRPARRAPSRRPLEHQHHPGKVAAADRIVSTGSSTAPLFATHESASARPNAFHQPALGEQSSRTVHERRPSPHVAFVEPDNVQLRHARRGQPPRATTALRHPAEHPLATLHLPPAAQPLKHGHIALLGRLSDRSAGGVQGSGVVLWLRGDMWALSADGGKLAHWLSVPRMFSRVIPNRKPSASWRLPPDLDKAGSIVNGAGGKHGRRLRFIASWITAERARAITATINLPAPIYPAGTTLLVHSDGPSPSLTLRLTCSSLASAKTTVTARWASSSPESVTIESRSAALWTRRVVQRSSGAHMADDGDNQAAVGTMAESTTAEERMAWGLLERCLRERVGEGVWRAIVRGGQGDDDTG